MKRGAAFPRCATSSSCAANGRLLFHDEAGGKTKTIIFSVKGGHLKAPDVRDLRGVIEREGAEIGVLISMDEPSAPMQKEAASAGLYQSPWNGEKYPRLQLRTIEQLLAGKGVDYPAKGQTNVTLKKAPKAATKGPKQLPLGAHAEDE